MAILTYLDAIRLAMLEEMQKDPRVFVMGQDVGAYGGAFRVTAGFLETFGEARVIDTPISESAIVGAAIGAALMGMRPIAEMQLEYDNSVNQLREGREGLAQYRALVERVQRQVDERRMHVALLEAKVTRGRSKSVSLWFARRYRAKPSMNSSRPNSSATKCPAAA